MMDKVDWDARGGKDLGVHVACRWSVVVRWNF